MRHPAQRGLGWAHPSSVEIQVMVHLRRFGGLRPRVTACRVGAGAGPTSGTGLG